MTPYETYLIWSELRRCAVELEAIRELLLVCAVCVAAVVVGRWIWKVVAFVWKAR